MKRSVLVISAIALALLAQHYLAERIHIVEALLFYAAAAYLAARVFAGTEAMASIGASWTRWTRSALGIACLLLVLSLVCLRSPASPFFGTLLWLASLVSFVLAFIGRTGTETIERQEALQRWELVVLGFIVVVGFLLRSYNLKSLPPTLHGDEAETGLQAIEIMEGRVDNLFTTGWYNLPLLGFATHALSMRAFGINIFGLRMASVIFGTLSLLPFYFLVRLLFRKQTAVISTTLLAISHWYIHFSRLGINYIQTPFFELLAFYFLLRALRFRKESDFVWSGLAVGFGFYTYYASRLVLLLILVFLAYRALGEKGFLRSNYRGMVLMAAAVVFAFAPMGLYFFDHGRQFVSRSGDVFIFAPSNLEHSFRAYDTRDPLRLLCIQTVRTLSVFNYRGDTSGQYGFREPILDFYTSAFFVLGLAYSLSQWRQWEHFFLNLWFWATIVMGSILTVDAPFTPRLVGMIPVLFVFAGLALDKTREQLSQACKPKWKRCFTLVTALTLLLIAYTNGDAYLNRYIGEQKPMSDKTELARYIHSLGPEYRTYLLGAPGLYFGFGTIRFIARGSEGVDVYNVADEIPIRSEVEKEAVFILLPSHLDALSFIHHYYPNGTLEEHRDVNDNLMFASYRVSREEILEAQCDYPTADFEEIAPPFEGPTARYTIRHIYPLLASYAQAPPPSPPPVAPDEWDEMLPFFVSAWGSQGIGPGEFNEPRDIAVDAKARLYVADTGNRRVQVFDSEGQFIASWNGGEKEFVEPLALVVDSCGDLYVLDSEPGWIYHLAADGTPLERFAGPEAGFSHPQGLAIDEADRLYVADTGGRRVVVYSAAGERLGQVGRKGGEVGELLEPADVVLDGRGGLYVVDTSNQQGQHPDRRDGYQAGRPISAADPHLTLVPDGSLLMTNPEQHKIQRYSPDGILLCQWGAYGTDVGQFRTPVGLAVDQAGMVYVADTLNHRVQKFFLQVLIGPSGPK